MSADDAKSTQEVRVGILPLGIAASNTDKKIHRKPSSMLDIGALHQAVPGTRVEELEQILAHE